MRQTTGILRSKLEEARASLWFMPAILVILSIGLSFWLLWIDRTYTETILQQMPWLFGGTSSSAQQLLGVIAGSVITVISIAFSLTIIAMQQASAQYTPRVLRNFTSDRGNQTVLGVYMATFVYSLLVLRAVRESDNATGEFVPSVAASVAIVLALLCIGLLIYFINHVASSLQASTVIQRVHTDLLDQINSLYPEYVGVPAARQDRFPSPARKNHAIHSKQGGFVSRIDENILESLPYHKVEELIVPVQVGDFVATGQIIASVSSRQKPSDSMTAQINTAIIITNQRSITEDPLFAIRQLVDIALKGLSPGINDVTTSSYCIRFLGDALGILSQRDLPRSERTIPGVNVRLYLNKPTWDDFVYLSFRQIMQYIGTNRQVLDVLMNTFDRIIDQLPNRARAKPIAILIDEIEENIDVFSKLASDKKTITASIRVLRKKISTIPA